MTVFVNPPRSSYSPFPSFPYLSLPFSLLFLPLFSPISFYLLFFSLFPLLTRNLSLGETLRFRPWWKHKHHGLEMGCTSGDHERALLAPLCHCLTPGCVGFVLKFSHSQHDQVKFICSRIKKRREPRVKVVTLKLCGDRKSLYSLYERHPTCAT